MKFDEIIQKLGEFGTYQKRIYVLVCILGITLSTLTFLPVFLIGVPNHRCAIPGLDNDTYLPQDAFHLGLINQTIPPNPKVDEETGVPYDRCNVYVSEENKTTHACSKWVYEKTTFTITFVTQENLVCDMRWTQSMMQMIYFAGLLVGSIGIGTFSDIFGRKKAMLVAYVFHITSGFAIIWAPNVATFAVMRFLTGVSVTGMSLSLFVLVMEYVGPSKRVLAGVIMQFFFTAGMVILVGVAYFLRDWNYLQLAMTVPSLFYISYFWLLSESPRWLANKGRFEEAEAIIRRAAAINKITFPDKIFDEKTLDESEAGEKMMGIFKSKVLVLRSLIIFFNWFAVTIGYYGLTLNSGSLSDNIFLDFLLSSLVEFPAYFLVLFGLDRFGRRKLHCATMIIGGTACISTIFLVLYADGSLNWITITLAMIGKFGITAAFAIIYVYTVELFPTIVRNSGIGASSMCARVGGMIGPYIVDGGRAVGGHFGTALPLLVIGVLALVAGLLSLFLPETVNKKLPETFEDAINFGRRGYKFNNDDHGKPVEGKNSAAHVNKSFTPDYDM